MLIFPMRSNSFLLREKQIAEMAKGPKRQRMGLQVVGKRKRPLRLLELNRGHWEIENRVHYVRDVTYDEDRSQIRKGNGDHIMASLRNLVIGIFRLLGFKYIPDAIKYFTMRLEETLQVVGV